MRLKYKHPKDHWIIPADSSHTVKSVNTEKQTSLLKLSVSRLSRSYGPEWTTKSLATPERMAHQRSLRNWRSQSQEVQLGYYDPQLVSMTALRLTWVKKANNAREWYRGLIKGYRQVLQCFYYIPTWLLYRKYMSQVVFAYCTLNVHILKLAGVQRVNIQKITGSFQPIPATQ